MADVAEEYRSSLSELNFNSKPHINMLTMLAEENLQHAPIIVKTIVDHINSVTPDMKLPSLYLVDSIVKNIGRIYSPLFSKHLVELFTSVFEKVDENIRSLLFKLRSTWTGIFPSAVLLELDKSVICLDPAWPVPQQSHKNIHVNPKFLDKPCLEMPKKNEALTKSQCALLEVEMKKQQLVLLKALEEKKKKLMELQKKASLTPAPADSSKEDIQKKVNARDPRLAKKASAAAVTDSATLQSVVVVPKENLRRRNEKGSSSSVAKKAKLDDGLCSPKKNVKSIPVGFPIDSKVNADQNTRNQQGNSTHTVNIQEDMKHTKQPLEASDLCHSESVKSDQFSKYPAELNTKLDSILQNKASGTLHQSNHPVNKILGPHSHSMHKGANLSERNNYFNHQPTMVANEEVFDKKTPKLEPPPLPPLFLGNEDKDYRILPKNLDDRKLNDASYCKRMYSYNNTKNRNYLFERNMHANSYCKKMRASSYAKSSKFYACRKGVNKSSWYDESDYLYNHSKTKFHPDSHKGISVPVVKSFKLDGKERKVYFVSERSFAFLDDIIPRELTFEGSPRLVFIEGLLQPIELGFGGQEVKFKIDGKFHFIKFGTPAREIYVDCYPYEASFGGLPFKVLLESGEVFRMRISGPAPNVVLSETPAFELYERFCQNNREFLRRFDNEPNINHCFSAEVTVPNRDVDMRVSNEKFSSSFFNFPLEKMNDVNWQRIHVGNYKQTEWNVPKNSFETFKDVNPNFIAQRNYLEVSDWNRSVQFSEAQNSALNRPPPLPSKQMINRLSGLPPSTTYGCTYGSANMPRQQFSSEYPRSDNGPFCQPKTSAETPVIPKLTPPPLPPFLATIPSTSGITGLSVTKDLVQTSVSYCNVSYCNSTVPSTLSLAQSAATVPPMNVEHMPMSGLTAPVLVTSTVISTPILSSTVPVQVPNINVSLQTSTSTTSTVQNTGPVNMNLILDQLVAAGVIGKTSGNSASSPASATSAELEKNGDDKNEEPLKEDPIPEIVFESKCLKEYYPGVISALHNGSQCATCGMRFKEIQSEQQYRRHLDWHFRRNQREKYGAKKPCSRRLFYEIKDWIQFKEFEDVDERAPSYFELQANGEQSGEVSPEPVCSVACSDCESEKCAVCGEQFQLFWVEEEEEWHLKNAVKHNDQVYHPSCYEDFEKANKSLISDPETSFEETKAYVKTEVMELDEDQVSPVKVKEEICEEDLKEKECESWDVKEEIKEIKKDDEEYIEKEEEMEEDEDEKLETESLELEVKETKSLELEVKETEVVIKVEPMEIEEVETNNLIVNEKSETESAESEASKSEIKTEPVDEPLLESKTEPIDEPLLESKTEPIDEPLLESKDINEESMSTSQNENVPSKSDDELEDIEFQPPTPDPQFQVLPPVSRGTEISNLCVIM